MRLFDRAQTGRPLRVAWALEEIGVDYEAVRLSADEAHRQRHPLGGVLAVLRFAGVLDVAPAGVVDYLDRLQARPAYTRALARTETLLAA